MKKNIAIVCLDKAMSRATAQLVADQLGMRLFDMRELFEFDHKPNTFKEIVTKYGIKYYRDKECSIMKYASDFENILMNLDADVLYKKGTLEKLGESYLIIYLHIPANKAANIMEKEEYSCYKEKSMYLLSKEQVETRISNAKNQCDIEVNISSSSYFTASADCIRAIHKYYNV